MTTRKPPKWYDQLLAEQRARLRSDLAAMVS
jgi:hypothetical protein